MSFSEKNSFICPMKNTYLLLVILFITAPLAAQNPENAAYIREHYTKKEVMIPMRDGIRLHTAIYTPKDQSQQYPILLKRTPYSCNPYGETDMVGTFQNMELGRSGYIFVFQDVRGRYMSEGDFQDVRPFNPSRKKGEIDEATDTYDTVEWLLANLNDNGKVGVYGISYPGFYATMAILAGHPAIKAVSPQAPVTDWFIGDDFHHNGALMLLDAFAFYSGFGKARPKPTTQGQPGFSDWKTPDNYDFFLNVGALPNFNRRFLKDSIAFWNDLVAHPNYDDWWKVRNPRPFLTNIQPAVLTVGGLFDAEDCFGAWNLYKAIEKQNPAQHSNRVVVGPWTHGGWARNAGDKLGNVSFVQKTSAYFQSNVEFKFFEFYLKSRTAMDLPEATVFETGSNQWTNYAAWPPAEAKPVRYYFQEKSQLSTTLPAAAKQADTYVSNPAKPVPYTEDVHLRRTNQYMTDDQRFAARRPDVLVYETPVLDKTLTVTGPVTAELWVSLDDDKAAGKNLLDADFVVKLIDVFPDTLNKVENGIPMGGYQMLVRGEIMRGRYRDSFETPAGFKRNKPYLVRFELPDVAHAFLPGHQLMIQVQSSWFPLADRNPQQFVDIYQASDSDFIPLTIRVWHDAKHPSAVVLPVKK
jgi:uncharacterized protein